MSFYTLEDMKNEDMITKNDLVERHDELLDTEDTDEDEQEELELLGNILSDMNDLDDGENLINEGYFEDYARDMAEDAYGVDTNQWPFSCIDWTHAANELEYDYTNYDVDGVDFLAPAS